MATTLTFEYRFRDLGPVPRGRFSPVGVSRAGEVFGNFVPFATGLGVVARWDAVSGVEVLSESLSLVETVSPDGRVVGSYGYGDGAFLYQDGLGMKRLGTEADRSSAVCAGPDGLVGGSTTKGGVESAVIFDGRETVVLPPPAAVVRAITGSGVVYGKTTGQDLFRWKVGDPAVEVFEVGAPFWILGVLPSGELVLNTLDASGLSAVKWSDGGQKSLEGIGPGVRALSVGESGDVLVSRSSSGCLEYGVWSPAGTVSWAGVQEIGDLKLESLSVIGKGSVVTGLATGPDGVHLVQGTPSSSRGQAVVEMPGQA